MVSYSSIVEQSQKVDEEINSIDESIRLLQEKIEILKQKKQKIFQVDEYDRKESLEIITYLVGKIEEKNYVSRERTIESYINDFETIRYIKYTLVYLVEKNMEEIAEKEISDRFPGSPSRDKYKTEGYYETAYSNYKINSAKVLPKLLDMPSDKYIQLAYYFEENDDGKISYTNKNHFNNNQQYPSITQINSSKICDERYHYIVDFMDMVTEYKLLKPDFELSKKEMYKLADEFISSYKPKKPYTYKAPKD